METLRDAVLLRAFIGEADRTAGRVLYRAIVEAALKAGLAGATALHGPLSYGHGRQVNSEFNFEAPRLEYCRMRGHSRADDLIRNRRFYWGLILAIKFGI
jgi:hypothetical protein